jgi:hypothetical protein
MTSEDMSILDTANSFFRSIVGGGQYPSTYVTSTVDGKQYKVRDMPDKEEAANLMAHIRMRLTRLCDALEKKYPDKAQVKQLVRNFRSDPTRFIESAPDEEHTSSTINKGESIRMCLRQREGGNEGLVDENVLLFVAIHELGHVCTESVGHGPDFWNNFGWLLKEAESLGIYKYTNFSAHPVSYCGVYITDAPRYDPAKDGTNFQIGTMTTKK